MASRLESSKRSACNLLEKFIVDHEIHTAVIKKNASDIYTAPLSPAASTACLATLNVGSLANV